MSIKKEVKEVLIEVGEYLHKSGIEHSVIDTPTGSFVWMDIELMQDDGINKLKAEAKTSLKNFIHDLQIVLTYIKQLDGLGEKK